ncbi:MAG TPA: citrate synthase [Acidobacteriota bacterium]|nr:citrate synthase [Acidobacteriota bacterium]
MSQAVKEPEAAKAAPPAHKASGTQTLTITDNRTGKEYEVPIRYGTYPGYGASINCIDLRKIKASDDDFGLLAYDPGFTNTASCKSSITFVDGEKGILRYRGYPIDQLAEQSSYLETAYLILFGELPTQSQLDEWIEGITYHTMIHENIKKFMDGFHYDAHPMGMLVGTLGALSTFYPDAKAIGDPESRKLQIQRLIAKMPTLAAFAYRHSRGLPYVYPDNDLDFAGNFLNMMYKATELKYEPDPILSKALDVLFILHADHEQNCSTSSMRAVGSSHSDPYSATAAGTAALYGPLHGGANEAVLRMLHTIGKAENVPAFVEEVKAGKAGRLMGFGHRVYKNYDPRAKVIKNLAHEVFSVTGVNPLLEIALELEKVALEDEYFLSRKLYPNVDFYSGIIYQAMGFPVDMFPVLFAIPRTSGWLAQWQEMLTDKDQRIARPRQVYTGADERRYQPLEQR